MAVLKIPVTAADHRQGPDDAPVTLVEYGDYECPYCAEAHPIVKRLRAQFGDRLRLVFRHFPLGAVHPNALRAAEVAEFAGAHGKFWDMHDLLYENQSQLGDRLYARLAQKLGLSVPALGEAVDEGLYEARVHEDFSGGVRSGVNGTPSFFINAVRYDGYYGEAELADAIRAALAGKG
ncbi:MAG: DsbA family protein [Sphingomonas sp.]